MPTDPATVLVSVVRERARILAPVIWLCSLSFVAASGAMAVRPPPWAFAVWCGLVTGSALLTSAFVLQKVPDRLVQIASTAILWHPAAMTLVGMYATRLGVYAAVLVVLVASSGALLHRRLTLGTIAVMVGLGSALVIRSHGPYTAVYVCVLLFATVTAMLIHFLMSRALVRAEHHRALANEAAEQLALRLEELQRAHEERARLQEQLLHAQRMEAVGTLAADVAHDMNNVLASIGGLAGLIRDEVEGEDLRGDVESILQQTERGAALTRSLLAFSRKGQYRRRPIQLWELVRALLPMLERTLPKSIEIRCELAGAACVDADATHLEQVLVNLALNASDAMAGGGTLTIAGEVVGERVRLRVTDTGVGMDEATRLRAFEPFFTTKPRGKGTGLGLATVWGIVQAHDGTVEVSSRPGAGATFTIELPRVQARTVAPPRVATSQEVASHASGMVLVVDDEPAVRAASKRLLERIGLQVMTAENGAEALEKFAAARDAIGAVVLDMGMPVMGGAECFARLREQSSVPVLIATGYAVDQEAQKLVAQGAALLEKPFSGDQYRREVGRLLARGQRERARA